MTDTTTSPRVLIIPGGAGSLGRALAAFSVGLGYRVIVLSRSPRAESAGVRYLPWDGRTLGPWAQAFNGAHAVVNLAGRSVNCRYNARNKQEIYDTRLQSTQG